MLDLGPPSALAPAADFFSQAQRAAVVETNELAAGFGVDLHHREALGITGPLIGADEKVVTILAGDCLLFRSIRHLSVDAQFGLDTRPVVDLLDAPKGVLAAPWAAARRHTCNTNMRKAGMDRSVIMKLTGHKTAARFQRDNTVEAADAQEAYFRLQAFREPE